MPRFLLSLLLTTLVAVGCSAGTGTSSTSVASTANEARRDPAQSGATQFGRPGIATAPKAVIAAVRKLAPHSVTIQAVDRTPVPGIYQVVASGQVVYVSADGRYMFNGDAFDLETQTALSDARMDQLRRDALAKIPADHMIRFAPAHPKYTVAVFTDVDCPYCRMFHAHIADYNAAGIAVDYLFWPRTGLDTPSYYKAVSVWCAADRKRAFTAAKAGADPRPARCDNPVKYDFELGLDLGVDGTPTIIAANGAVLNGFATPAQLLRWLGEKPGPGDGETPLIQ